MFKRFAAATAIVMVLLLSVISGGGIAWAGTVTGTIVTPTGGPVVNGTLGFTLSQPATLSGVGSVVTTPVSCYTSSTGTVVGLPDPLTPPFVNPNTSTGTLPAGTYYSQLSYYGAGGEALAGPESTTVLSSTGKLIFSSPLQQPASATGYKVYIGSSSGTETLQATVTGFGQYSQSTPLVIGAALPASNTSVCSLAFSDTLVPTGTSYRVSLLSKNGTPVSGFPQTWCTYGGLSGTINVSNGAPTGNCSTNGVFYPTPILTNPPNGGGTQSVQGSLNIAQNLILGGNLTLGGNIQVAGNWVGNMNLTGTFTAKSVNGVLNANLFSGANMGAKINAAISSLAGACGTIIVPNGNYSVSTAISKPKCVLIDLQGSVLNFAASALPAIISGDSGSTTSFTMGGIINGVINGSGRATSALGIWLGGDTGAINAPANYSDWLENFRNLTVQNFGAGYTVGYKAFQIMWTGGIIQQNTWGIQNANQFYSENMNLHGTQIINNVGNGIVIDGQSDFHLYGVSLDYNQGGAIQLNSGGVSMTGGNIEQLSGLAINSPASVNGLIVGLYHVRLAMTDPAGSQTALLVIGGTNSNVTLEGVHLIHLHAVTQVVTWNSLGTVNAASLDFHDDSGITILPTQAGANIQSYHANMPWNANTFNRVSSVTYAVNGTPEIFYVAADFTQAANTNLQTITGLSWTLIASTVQVVPFSCHLMYSQATAAVADQFGLQSTGLNPTNIAAKAQVATSVTAETDGNLPTLATQTATAVVTFTPTATATVFNADMDGLIENPSGAATTVNIMVQTSNSADLVTIKRGSFCRVY